MAEHGITIVKTFRVHGYSASHRAQEPALREAIADIQSGDYSALVVTESSRPDRHEDLGAQANAHELDALVAERKAVKARIEGFAVVPDSFDYELRPLSSAEGQHWPVLVLAVAHRAPATGKRRDFHAISGLAPLIRRLNPL